MTRDLAASIRAGKTLLFAGAGLSMMLGLPSWQALIDHLAAELGTPDAARDPSVSCQTLAEYHRLKHGDLDALTNWIELMRHSDDG